MKVDSRVQLNLMLGSLKFNSKLKPFEDTVIPVFWLEIVSNGLLFPVNQDHANFNSSADC